MGAVPLAGSGNLQARPAAAASAARKYEFKTYRENSTLCQVTRITPDDGYYLHTFFDICPWSPSERYLACLKFPFQNHEPVYTDEAIVCLIDMRDQSITELCPTTAWGFQIGTSLQWGATDRHLYFNDQVDGEGVCIRLDLETGKREPLAGPMYHISPDESCVISFPLDLINEPQSGYGYSVDPARLRKSKPGASKDEGIWRTDLKTNKKTLLLSLAEAYEVLPDEDKKRFKGGKFYFFHSKFNPQGTKIMQVFRCMTPGSGKQRRIRNRRYETL